MQIEFKPEQTEGFQRLGDLPGTLRLEIAIQIDREFDVSAGAFLKRTNERHDLVEHTVVEIDLGMTFAHAETTLIVRRDPIRESEDIGLQRRETPSFDLLPQRRDVFQGPQRSRAKQVGMAHAKCSAVRPICRKPIAHRAAEQLEHRNAERLCLDIKTRIFNGGVSLRNHSTSRGPGVGIKPGADLSDFPWILPYQLAGDFSDHAGQARTRPAFAKFGPPDQSAVGCNLEK